MNKIKRMFKLLSDNKIKISTCESMTGGFLSYKFIKYSGASKFYLGSIIAYSNLLKEKIVLINSEILKKYGSISKEVASLMAINTNKILKSDLSISVTGNAGPNSIENKPVGKIYLAISYKNKIYNKTIYFQNNKMTRIKIIKKTVKICIR